MVQSARVPSIAGGFLGSLFTLEAIWSGDEASLPQQFRDKPGAPLVAWGLLEWIVGKIIGIQFGAPYKIKGWCI